MAHEYSMLQFMKKYFKDEAKSWLTATLEAADDAPHDGKYDWRTLVEMQNFLEVEDSLTRRVDDDEEYEDVIEEEESVQEENDLIFILAAEKR